MSNLPTGIVTFLFTDIEGSTRLLQQLGEKFATLLADHERLLRESCETHNGRVIDTQGDSFFIAFSRAVDAVNAAIQAQRALATHVWPDGVSVRVRMGLHTGEPQIRDVRYVGIDVHRSARITAVAHGGQVLLSQTTYHLVAGELPDGVTVRDLGEHRLKDLRQPKHLYQLVVSGLPSDFPPLNSLNIPQNNLPIQLTSFIGREKEIKEVKQAIHEHRLVTLTGPGGSGKTRLALELARSQLDQFRDGVFFVSLAAITSASGVAPAIASAMKLQLQGNLEQALMHVLHDKQLLLILDNCEQLLSETEATASTNLVVQLLLAAPQVYILITSREPLQARGEQVYPLEGLDYAGDATVEAAGTASAVQLFLQSARRTLPSFKLDTENVQSILRICQLVEGIPLGIELAAVWLGSLSPAEIASEIERSADFLMSEWRDVPERQQSMRAVFDWSWGLLNDAEQKVFRQLSVFRGGFTREAAQAVTGASLLMLTRLVRKSLLSHLERGRYEIHELLRQFAVEKLAAFPEERAAVEREHGEYFLAFVAARERRLTRNEPKEAAEEIRGEIDNVRKAWRWALTHVRLGELDRNAPALWQFYLLTGLYAEGEHTLRLAAEWVQSHLSQASESEQDRRPSQRTLSKLLAIQARFLTAQGKNSLALPIAQQAVALGEASGGVEGQAIGHLVLGQALIRIGRHQESLPHLEQALQLVRLHQGERRSVESLFDVECTLYVWLGERMFSSINDYTAAATYFTEALRLSQAQGSLRHEMTSLYNLGDCALRMGEYASAKNNYERALQIARSLSYRWGEGATEWALGDVLRLQGEYPLAQSRIEHALTILREIGDYFQMAPAISCLARLNSYQGNYSRAREWLEQFWQVIRVAETPWAEVDGLLSQALIEHYTDNHERALEHAEKAWQIALHSSSRNIQAGTLIILGHVRASLNQLVEAETAYQQTLVVSEEVGNTSLAAEARAGLAAVALTQGDQALAITQVEEILQMLAGHPRAGLDEPFLVYLTCYRVLEANRDPRTASVLETASSLLDEYASHFTDEAHRHAFLYNVPSHRELMQARESVRSARN